MSGTPTRPGVTRGSPIPVASTGTESDRQTRGVSTLVVTHSSSGDAGGSSEDSDTPVGEGDVSTSTSGVSHSTRTLPSIQAPGGVGGRDGHRWEEFKTSMSQQRLAQKRSRDSSDTSRSFFRPLFLLGTRVLGLYSTRV